MSTYPCHYFFAMARSPLLTRKSPKQYHHGNLRAALIQTGLKLIGKKGVRALTLREIGSQLGVSRMAAYRHFSSKAELLQAIREAGFAQFADALEAARETAPKTFAGRLKAMAFAYVRFAAEHPAHYEVMFGWREEAERTREHGPAAERAFGLLERTIREGQESGDVRGGDSVTLARLVWAEVHGISMLQLAPDLRPGGAGAAFIELSSGILVEGLAPNRAASLQ